MKRKEFLKLSGSLALGAMASPGLKACMNGSEKSESLKSFGLQLYTLRADMPSDPKGILKQVASFGYKEIESYEGPKGMFWGMKNSEFKKYMDDLGVAIISSHCNPFQDFQKKVDEAASIGMKYLVHNWPGQFVTMDEYKKMADLYNQWGEICKKAGIRFANHNYDKNFMLLDGIYPQDIIMERTNPDLVDYQMDIYWVVLGGADPEHWLNKYPNRFRLCHIKDRTKGATKREDTCNIGDGSIDYKKILKSAADNGMQYYIVEQEHYDGTTPLKAVEAGARYLSNLKF